MKFGSAIAFAACACAAATAKEGGGLFMEVEESFGTRGWASPKGLS